ncbi:transcriptional regulator, GntR family domain protein [Pseudomonas putida S610]|nr:transcriptional regulator, GntR family domain protein [Pseudomonas putida S610]
MTGDAGKQILSKNSYRCLYNKTRTRPCFHSPATHDCHAINSYATTW